MIAMLPTPSRTDRRCPIINGKATRTATPIQTLGPVHPTTALASSNLAYNLNGQGKYGEAELLLRRAWEILLIVRGPDHLNAAAAQMVLGLCRVNPMLVE